MPLKPIEEILPNLVKIQCRQKALSNWGIISQSLARQMHELPSEENKRALIATILVETASTFEPIHEFGSKEYFVKNYWEHKSTREALGNVVEADAVDYCGKGFIQLTGRANYERCAKALNMPLMSQPGLLMLPGPSADACVWFWTVNGLPELIQQVVKYKDTPNRERVWTQVRRKVNGGTNGLLPLLSHLEALGVK